MERDIREWMKLFTTEEIELNRRLYEACVAREVDLHAVEALLQQGADPLGPTELEECDEHLFGNLICDALDNLCPRLPELTELFLKYGMDITKPKLPYDGGWSIHPMWEMGLGGTNETILQTLKRLLDHGLDADSAAECWSHALMDSVFLMCGFGDLSKKGVREELTWTLKMVMLIASYEHILSTDDELRRWIGCKHNDYELLHFREWNDFSYEFDDSRMIASNDRPPNELIVTIFEKSTGRQVWRFCWGNGDEKV